MFNDSPGGKMKQRVGLFYIQSEVLIVEDLAAIHGLFKFLEYIPYHTEHEFVYARFKHIGISPCFDEIEEGVKAPVYDILIHTHENEDKEITYTYEVKKLEGK